MEKCPKCGCSAYTKQGFDKKGQARRSCKYCGCKYTATPIQKPPKYLCPYCKQRKAVRNGQISGNRHKYQCRNCGKNFQYKYKRPRISEHTKKMSVLYVQQGFSMSATAKAFKIDVKSLWNFMNKKKAG